jgi:CysZ protein
MLGQPGLRHFVWGPLLINLLLYCLGGWLGVHYFSAVLNGLIPGWLEWLRWLLWPLFALVLSAIAFFSFTLVANIIAAPFYGPLAVKVLSNLGIAVAREESGGFATALLSGLAAEGRRMAYFALRALPLVLLSFIPVVNLIAPLLWLVFGAWSLSLEYLAYPLEAQGLRFDQQRKLVGSHRLEALSFGGAIMVGLGIPVLNILIAPAAVVGASLYTVDKKTGLS